MKLERLIFQYPTLYYMTEDESCESIRHLGLLSTSALLDRFEAEEDVLAYYAAFPSEYWQKIWSNNPLERVNKEVKRRTNVVGILPTEESVIRLVGAVLCEQHELEWQVSKRYFSAGSLAKLERKEEAVVEQPELMAG